MGQPLSRSYGTFVVGRVPKPGVQTPGYSQMSLRDGSWPVNGHRGEKTAVLRRGLKRFVNAYVRVPCQVVRTGRRLVYRLLAWNPWQHVFLRGVDALQTMSAWRHPLRC